MKDFNSLEYKRSRASYVVQCTVEYFVSLLVTDAFLAKLLTGIGIKDSYIGIISSFISLAFVIQLMSIFLMKLKVSTKKLVIFFDTLSIVFFMLIYLIPFVPGSVETKTVIVMASVMLAYAGKYLIYSIYYKWANSFVEPRKRASYSAKKEIISLLSGMIFTAVIGYIIDKYESIGDLNGGFVFLAIAMLVLNICNLISLVFIKKEEDEDETVNTAPFSEILKNTVFNKDFRNVIILMVMWDVARYFSIGFMGTFKTKDLMISVFAVQLINIASSFLRMAISVPLGIYSDKHSYAKGFGLGLMIAAAGFFVNIFTSTSTWYFIIIYTLLYNCAAAGTNQNSFNIAYSYVDAKYITQAMAFKNSIGGIMGFLASVVAGKILSAVQANGNRVFGIPIYGQQLLSAISFVIVVAAIIFSKKVIEKQKVTIQ